MPCFILTGHPCAGKTTFANKLKERALQHSSNLIDTVVILNEESVCVNQTKAECYATSQTEKKTRAALKAELDKCLASRTLVILDSMNYIKGYRYELHCLSKAAGERHGVIWILNSVDTVRQWNHGTYPNELLEELILRYEPPDARNRWDRPLYRIDLSPESNSSTTNEAAQDALHRSVYNMHALSDAITDSAAAAPLKPRAKSAASSFKKKQRASNKSKGTDTEIKETLPTTEGNTTSTPITAISERAQAPSKDDVMTETLSLEQRIDEILDSYFLDVQPLKEGTSTHQNMLGDSNVLNLVDSLTQKVCNIIAQAPSGRVELVDYGVSITSARKLALPELQRLRQQYVRWVAQHPPSDASERGIVMSFVQYLEGHV
jgi:protein KTI12